MTYPTTTQPAWAARARATGTVVWCAETGWVDDSCPTAEVAPDPGRGGWDFRGTEEEGVLIRTLDADGERTDQALEVTIGFRNFGAAVDAYHAAKQAAVAAGRRDHWLPLNAQRAVDHLTEFGYTVRAGLSALAEPSPWATAAAALR